MRFTPEIITKLEPNEIFVFGSNLAGQHLGGAARVAKESFGAIDGQPFGLQGQSFAIPTLGAKLEQLPEEVLYSNICMFLDFVLNNQDKTFYLTKIGLGIAGYDIEFIKGLFWAAIRSFAIEPSWQVIPSNLVIPEDFLEVKNSPNRIGEEIKGK